MIYTFEILCLSLFNDSFTLRRFMMTVSLSLCDIYSLSCYGSLSLYKVVLPFYEVHLYDNGRLLLCDVYMSFYDYLKTRLHFDIL